MSAEIEVLKTAGFRVTEVAQLMQVSRPTASNWFSGVHEPHSLVRKRLDKLVDATRRAVEAGELPIPPTVIGKDVRWQFINDVIARFIAAKQTA